MGSKRFGFEGEVVKKIVKAEKDMRRIESLIVRPAYTGTAFPTSPSSGDTFYRTDLGMWFYYTGSEWRSHEQWFNRSELFLDAGDAPINYYMAMRQDIEYVVTKCVFRTYPASTNDVNNRWNVAVRGANLALGAFTTHYSFNVGSDTDDDWTAREAAPATGSPGANDYSLNINLTVTGSPGSFSFIATIYYYWIAT